MSLKEKYSCTLGTAVAERVGEPSTVVMDIVRTTDHLKFKSLNLTSIKQSATKVGISW